MEEVSHDMYAPYVHRTADGILRDGGGRDSRPLCEFTRDELLWLFRTHMEGAHRNNNQTLRGPPCYDPSVRDAAANRLPEISDHHWIEFCNKSVPVYILPGDGWVLLRAVLDNYIYRRWFRPYRSEIDFSRYICKFILPDDLPDNLTVSPSTIRDIVLLNHTIINKFESQRILYLEERAAAAAYPRFGPKNLDHYVLQPLFRALLIIVSPEKYNKETSSMLGHLPVYLVRTGVEEGLSAPISFEPIAARISNCIELEAGQAVSVTLETAIDFVISLEAREAAAFGLRPDPATDWKPSENMIEAWHSIGDTEPLVGPNSQWVNIEKYPQWSGNGKRTDAWLMSRLEEQTFRTESRIEKLREARRIADAAGESAVG
ncbi:hypothetical protein V8C35DRAFT_327190 [Trichoderma chlorosporum]